MDRAMAISKQWIWRPGMDGAWKRIPQRRRLSIDNDLTNFIELEAGGKRI